MKSFGRVLTAMVTPFKENQEVDFEKTAQLAKYLADHGSDGVVVCGTTGESPTLSKEEKIKLWETVKDAVGDRIAVIGGSGSNNTKDSIALTKEAEKIGLDGAMIVGPYYNKPSQEGFFQHFKAIAESTSLPLIVYNVPGRTGSNILPETIIRLAELPNIAAVKEASGCLDQASQLIRSLPERIAVYSGDDSLTLPILSIGGAGIISVVSHVVGDKLKEMVDSFFAGDMKKATSLHLELFPVFKGMFITSNPVPVKAALALMGFPVGGPRLPLVEANEKELATIKNVLANFQ